MKKEQVDLKKSGEQSIDPLKKVEEELLKTATNVKAINVLFMDISSTCIGYTVVSTDFETRTANVNSSGALWLPDVDHGAKYNFAYQSFLTYFDIIHKIDHLVYEQYSINPKKLNAVTVVPEMIGAIKAATSEIGIKYSHLLPQQWRSTLKIKRTPEKDYKKPTKERILEYVSVPEKVISNTSNQERNTPSDLYDSLGLTIAWLQRMNFNKITFNSTRFQEHVGVLDV